MKVTLRLLLVFVALVVSGCASKKTAPESGNLPAQSTQSESQPNEASKPSDRFTGAGHDFANAIQFSGINNPIAFSQKQQEWLWLNYRDWKKQGQSIREKDGVQYDEVRLTNRQGETRVIYFRMPGKTKP